MSVRVADQKQTDIWFIKAISELCGETSAMVLKRKQNTQYAAYVPIILDCSVKLLTEAQLANNIMISKTTPYPDFVNRRQHFQNALGYLDTYEMTVNIFVNICMVDGSYNKNKAYNFFKNIGNNIYKIRLAITKILKSDLDKLRKIEKENIQRQTIIQMNAQKAWYEEQIQQRKDNGTIIKPIIFFKNIDNYVV